MNTNADTFHGFDPLITWKRDCDAWRECLKVSKTTAGMYRSARELWLLAVCLRNGRDPRHVGIIANLLGVKGGYG